MQIHLHPTSGNCIFIAKKWMSMALTSASSSSQRCMVLATLLTMLYTTNSCLRQKSTCRYLALPNGECNIQYNCVLVRHRRGTTMVGRARSYVFLCEEKVCLPPFMHSVWSQRLRYGAKIGRCREGPKEGEGCACRNGERVEGEDAGA